MSGKRIVLLVGVAVVLIAGLGYGVVRYRSGEAGSSAAASIYDIEVRDIDGNQLKMDRYRGKALLVVNVASKCRFTPQYEGLQRLHERYGERGLVVLGFPANNFAWREPGTDAEIREFCSSKYHVSFPLFSKISVAGEDRHALYRWLTDSSLNPQLGGTVTWNFNKFLIGRDGRGLARFDSEVTPESETLVKAIEAALD